ncbi:hypothetical protein EDC94DRAFT_609047 [Helicostylum pulchrum]|uniref:START domain-containing protein n=1 Tax=Helicostylum pulchrum TaxID=562976 RepID=A0ABP9Y3I7_9FUNG|nr:hypothetical protein EDC94DRAFT_609047 [Helicostylum pulchrum]
MTAPNPHTTNAKKAMQLLKEYTDDLEGWSLVQESKSGVKVYNKSDGSAFPLLRGEILLSGAFSPEQVAIVATLPGCRKMWDEKFDTAQVKQYYSADFGLLWFKVKTPWPVSPRDMAAISYTEKTADSVYIAVQSVKDASIPEVSGCVRASLLMSGWKIIKTNAGVAISYVTQIDLAGSIPASLLKSSNLQIPLCAGTMTKYLKDHGFPPLKKECTATVVSETFDHAKKEYVVQWSGKGNSRYEISKKMFPSGVKVKITGKAAFENKGDLVIVTGINGSATMKLTKA